MTHFNILDQQNNNIGNGIISNDKSVKITAMNYNGQQYANLVGKGNNNNFDLGFSGKPAIFTGNNLQPQYFNIYSGTSFVGMARFMNTINV